MKMEKETFDVLVKQVKDAVIEDLTSTDPTRTILKARIWCRDDEDQFDLYCLYDFSPYMDMLFRRFEPDVTEWIREQCICLKEHFMAKERTGVDIRETNRYAYRLETYSEEEIYRKFYITVTKYVEISGRMIILYSADFSLKGEVIAIDDPTGYYTGFQYEGYKLSKSEKIISDNLSLFFRGITGAFSEEPYQKGDILYVDGSPYESPFYAVDCGKRLLYIENAESVTRCLQYDLAPRYYPKREVELRYRDTIPLCYKVQKVEECRYKCLTEAGRLIKSGLDEEEEIKEKVGGMFLEEFRYTPVKSEYQSESRIKEIAGLITELSEKYPEMPFTAFFREFKDWMEDTRKISDWNRADMDDKWLLAFLSEYSGRNLKLYRYQREKFKRKCQDRNPVFEDV